MPLGLSFYLQMELVEISTFIFIFYFLGLIFNTIRFVLKNKTLDSSLTLFFRYLDKKILTVICFRLIKVLLKRHLLAVYQYESCFIKRSIVGLIGLGHFYYIV